MDQAVSQFFTAGTAILAISVVIITFFIRRVVETAIPLLKKQADENHPAPTYATYMARWWSQVLLYLIPVAVGATLGAMDLPYLFSIEGLDPKSKVFFGGVIGWMASFIYKCVRMVLKKKTGLDIQPTASTIPGASEDNPEET